MGKITFSCGSIGLIGLAFMNMWSQSGVLMRSGVNCSGPEWAKEVIAYRAGEAWLLTTSLQIAFLVMLAFWVWQWASPRGRRLPLFLVAPFCLTFFSYLSLLFRLSSLLGKGWTCLFAVAAQLNSFKYHTQPALSYHRGCAAPSVFPSWLCREDRHLPKVSWSASVSSVLAISSHPCALVELHILIVVMLFLWFFFVLCFVFLFSLDRGRCLWWA